jgi:hypothetical protein
MEVTLATALVLVFLGMFVVNYTGARSARELTEGVERFGTALRMARADAASTGRRLRLSFDEETAEMQILWEPQPLAEPGQFTPYHACTWRHHLPTGLVRVSRCQLVGSSAYQTMTAGPMDNEAFEQETLEAVTFYPDGSSDSVVIELIAARDDPAEAIARAVIQLDGWSGVVTTDILTPEDAEALDNGEWAGLESDNESE